MSRVSSLAIVCLTPLSIRIRSSMYLMKLFTSAWVLVRVPTSTGTRRTWHRHISSGSLLKWNLSRGRVKVSGRSLLGQGTGLLVKHCSSNRSIASYGSCETFGASKVKLSTFRCSSTVALELLIASPRVSAIGVGHLSESTYDCEARTELSQIVLRTKFGTLIRCT